MFEGLEKIWLDGELVPEAEATTHVLAHSLHYGTGVFEGIRCYDAEGGPAIFRLDEHVRRLLYSAEVIGLPVGYSAEELAEACLETLRANGLQSAYLRPLIFFGRDTLGVPPLAPGRTQGPRRGLPRGPAPGPRGQGGRVLRGERLRHLR
jgi:branched-chain amino acid aminotransferase